MSLIEYKDLEQGTDEWLKARLGLVTASVIGKLITAKTLKPANNDEARGLTAQLVAERVLGWSDPSFFNQDMQRGHDIEPIARDWYSQREGVEVAELGFMVRDDWGFSIGYSPDGLVGEDGLIEVKAPRAKTHMLTHLSGEMPAYHMPQVQTGLLVSGRKFCDFISFYAGMPPFVKRIHRDPQWHDAIIAAVEQFERNADLMLLDYAAATTDIPTTERLLIDMEMSF
jgi:hypothetical protein